MAVYAAMIDRLDQNIGRLLEKLRSQDKFENTLIIFLIDNGASPFDNGGNTGHGPPNFGAAGSYNYQRPEWAAVANTPWRYYKRYGYGGGSRTPFIAHWPLVIRPGMTKQLGHVADLLPTMLDLAGVNYPVRIADGPTPELDGESLAPIFHGEERDQPEILVSGFQEKNRMIRVGRWQIVRLGNGPWKLYDMQTDPSEMRDLAAEHPDRLAEVLARYEEWKLIDEVDFGKKRFQRLFPTLIWVVILLTISLSLFLIYRIQIKRQ
jgi:arylsulfatase